MKGVCGPVRRVLLIVLATAFLVPASLLNAASSARPGAGAPQPKAGGATPKVRFVELGSVGCKPCEAMKPVMEEVRKRYGDQVEVIFHDVKRDPGMARAFHVVLIPTQVFLDANGREAFRHQGFFAFEEVDSVLKGMGVH